MTILRSKLDKIMVMLHFLVSFCGVALASLVRSTSSRVQPDLVVEKTQCKREITDRQLFPRSLQQVSRFGDRIFSAELNEYAFGRWKQPVHDVSFHVDEDWKQKAKSLFKIKNWDYRSIDSRDFFIGAAIVKLGYASDAFLYVVDKRSSHFEKFEWTGRLPGNFGVSFSASPIDDRSCTSFSNWFHSVSFCHHTERGGWTIRADVSTTSSNSDTKQRVILDAFMQQQEALTVLFPLANDTMRPAYVHKGAGSPVTGTLTFGDTRVDLEKLGALGAIDWTRSMALRCTQWKWASSNFYATVTTLVDNQVSKTEQAMVGINFSQDVYDIDGESQENAIWINGQVHVLRGVAFQMPAQQPLQDKWQIKTIPGLLQSNASESVQLEFTPKGAREEHIHLLIFESDFVQPFGFFNGLITFTTTEGHHLRVEVENAFGVVENHLALW